MSTMDESIAVLRQELAGLQGPARTSPLVQLGQALLSRVVQNGPTAPSALPDLDAAVAVLDEGLGYLGADDPARAAVSCVLGLVHSWRGNYVNDPASRDAAIRNLSAALAASTLPEAQVVMARMALGSQYVFRGMAPLMSGGATMNLVGALGNPALADDYDRGAECFRTVLAGKPVSTEIQEFAQVMLELVEGFRPILGGGAAGFSFDKLGSVFAAVQTLQDRVNREVRPGYGIGLPNLFEIDVTRSFLTQENFVSPVAVVTGETEEKQPLAAPEPEPEAPQPDDLRQSLRKRLALDPDVPVWTAAAALLMSEVDVPPVAVADDVVALAGTVVDQEDDDVEPADAAVDWFMLAVAFHVRDRVGSGGTHRQAGADALLVAARKVPVEHPAATVIMGSLGAFLDPDHPLGGVLDQAAAGFAGRLDALLAGESVTDPGQRATLHALRCVCRAAWAIGELGRAVDQVQPGYPWVDRLKASQWTG